MAANGTTETEALLFCFVVFSSAVKLLGEGSSEHAPPELATISAAANGYGICALAFHCFALPELLD